MAEKRTGVWIIGARGSVATTVALGLGGLKRELLDTVGIISARPPFTELDLIEWNDLVLGGHEIRHGALVDAARELFQQIRLPDQGLIEACRGDLEEIDSRLRGGTTINCGETIGQMADPRLVQDKSGQTGREIIHRLQYDLRRFQHDSHVDRVIVVNLASTEPPTNSNFPDTWNELDPLLDEVSDCVGEPRLPASSLYAIAALDLGMPYINFTPSLGSTPPAICDLAIRRGTCHAGRDGKTGETMLKTVLSPMFSLRNLEVMSWVGHNIFGNLDAKVLDNPANKSAKVRSKDQVLGQILGYDPQTLVSIEHIASLGDWKTAWDHIHFRGFLGTPMTMQFTWQGCDSVLAAPLVLDLVRFVELAVRRGESGILSFLASFFKSPMGTHDHDLFHQFSWLTTWAEVAQTGRAAVDPGHTDHDST